MLGNTSYSKNGNGSDSLYWKYEDIKKHFTIDFILEKEGKKSLCEYPGSRFPKKETIVAAILKFNLHKWESMTSRQTIPVPMEMSDRIWIFKRRFRGWVKKEEFKSRIYNDQVESAFCED